MLLNNRVRKIDFQDLVVFQQIYDFKNVSAVAEKMNVSQSTISYCLKRLRDCFGDDLFVNTRIGMHPTPRAEAMAPRVRIMLNQMVECAQESAEFDPVSQPSTFTICAPEYFEIVVMPELMRNISDAGYRVSLNIRKPERELPYSEMLSGQVDLTLFFGPGYYQTHPSLYTQTLFRDCLLGVYEGTNDARPLTGTDMLARKHIFPTPWLSDSNMVDGWMLRHLGERRNIAARANSYYAAISMLPNTDLMMMLPDRVHKRLCHQQPKLGFRPAPEGLPDFTLDMIWSASVANRQENIWLRKQLIKACATI